MIHEVIVTECEKYPSTTILKPATISAKLIKLRTVDLFKMMLNKKLPVLKCTCAQLPYQKLVAIKVSNPSTEVPGS